MSIMEEVNSKNLEVFLEKKKEKVNLSERQQQVLNLIAFGDSYKVIAYKLQISDNTVAYHVSVIKTKLKCINSRGVIPAALELGLISYSG